MSFDDEPQMFQRDSVVPLATRLHAIPFQCTIVPFVPAAHTSVADAPHTESSCCDVPLGTGLQAIPFQCIIVPAPPTAQTSPDDGPQTRKRPLPWGCGYDQHQPSMLQ